MRKIIAYFMSLLLILVLFRSTAYAISIPYKIQPKYTKIMQFEARITISSDGYVKCPAKSGLLIPPILLI